MHFYDYFRSSAAYRCRIALNLKGLSPERTFVNLRTGAVREDWYQEVNPQQLVPAVRLEDGTILTQSLAIIEYLDETVPNPPLLPADPVQRAKVRAVAQAIACDIHPLNNLRVLSYISGPFAQDEASRNIWYHNWIDAGFSAMEKMLPSEAVGAYCFGDEPTLGDVCLVPQIYNARRFKVDMSAYPRLMKIDANLQKLDAFADAAPEKQPDAV